MASGDGDCLHHMSDRRPALLLAALAAQIPPDGLVIAAGMPGDRRHRPAPRLQRVNLHVVLLCEHPPRGLLAAVMDLDSPDGAGGPRQNRARARARCLAGEFR